MKKDALILVRGGGDLATGTIHRLWSAGLRVLVLEAEHPAAIRRQVSLCEAVYEGETTVEGLRAVRIETLAQAEEVWKQNAVPVLVDPQGKSIAPAKPDVLVDAILAKKNLGTTRDMAPLTIALGPGFTAGQDVDVVVETKRGHRLGRIIREGSAIPDTGIPSSSLNLVKSKPCIFFNTSSMASLISALLALPMSCDCTKFRSLAMALAASVAFFPIQLSRYSSPERETRFASICRWACSFLLSVPLCRMMMYWWFASPMRCMKSLPSSAQSASVKVALSSIEGLTSKRRQLFFTFGKSAWYGFISCTISAPVHP